MPHAWVAAPPASPAWIRKVETTQTWKLPKFPARNSASKHDGSSFSPKLGPATIAAELPQLPSRLLHRR